MNTDIKMVHTKSVRQFIQEAKTQKIDLDKFFKTIKKLRGFEKYVLTPGLTSVGLVIKFKTAKDTENAFKTVVKSKFLLQHLEYDFEKYKDDILFDIFKELSTSLSIEAEEAYLADEFRLSGEIHKGQ